MIPEKQLRSAAILFASLFVAGAMILAFALGGCGSRVKAVTNLPPGVTLKEVQDWDAAIADLHKVASIVSRVHKAVTDLHAAQYDGKPVLSDEYYAEAIRTVAHIDQLELSAESVLRKSPQNFSETTKQQVAGYVSQISTELQHLNSMGATGIKNPKSLQQVNNLLGEVTAVVALILNL